MKEKLLKFVKENGFLLFLFICVGIVAFSTIYVVTKDLESEGGELLTKNQMESIPERLNKKEGKTNTLKPKKGEDSKELAKEEESKKEDSKKEDSNKEEKESKLQKDLTLVKEDENKVEEELAQETFSGNNEEKNIQLEEKEGSKEISGFMMPINGGIITEFTTETLVYSKTLDEWRSHPGIDIAAKVGEKVKAPLDGVVKDIVEDPLWGKVVFLDHGNGLVTKFANLGDTNMIKKGLNVKKGDYIATVAKTADIEMLMDPHLHFEVIKDGKLVDPRSIP